MIGKITGSLVYNQPPRIMVDVNGVGYEIDIPMSSVYKLPQLNEKVSLYTHLSIREDAQALYGFISFQERQVFKELIRVSGIGTRTALAILSGLEVDEIISAIANHHITLLSTIPGIGKKTAERLVLELSNRLTHMGSNNLNLDMVNNKGSVKNDAVNALLALGYNEKEAFNATKKIDAALNLSDTIKQALNILSQAK